MIEEKVFYVAGNFAHQGACSSVSKYDSIILKTEPDNPHDSDAIKVMTKYGSHLGYVPASKCKSFHKLFRSHTFYCARVRDIKGGNGYDYLPQIEVYFAKSESDLPFAQAKGFGIKHWLGLVVILVLIIYLLVSK